MGAEETIFNTLDSNVISEFIGYDNLESNSNIMYLVKDNKLVEQINEDVKTAMKNQDKEKLNVIRMVKSALQMAKINLKRLSETLKDSAGSLKSSASEAVKTVQEKTPTSVKEIDVKESLKGMIKKGNEALKKHQKESEKSY